MYSYSSSQLHLALIKAFADVERRLPNLVIAKITKQSTLRAFTKGISADEIIAFLCAYAHPRTREHDPILPVSVSGAYFQILTVSPISRSDPGFVDGGQE